MGQAFHSYACKLYAPGRYPFQSFTRSSPPRHCDKRPVGWRSNRMLYRAKMSDH